MPKPNICIVGGGIGGLATAVALDRAGIKTVVYERAPQLLEAGAGMSLWPNATRALRDLGVLDDVLACAGSSTNFLVRSSRGRVLMDLALGEFDVPALCVHRADLHSILLSRVPAGRIRLGCELNGMEQAGSKMRLTFENGRQAEYDAVIGADGIRSRVRAGLFGPSDPVFRGYVVWRGIARYHGQALRPNCNSETWGAGNRFGILNMGGGRFTWYATDNDLPDRQIPRADQKRELLRMFGDWHEPIPHLIEGTGADEILRNGAYDRAPLRRWGKGAVTLLGDAAHPCTPNLGQGGGMAIEDALVLAKCVAGGGPISAAFRRYESLRRRRTRHITQRSQLIGHIGQWEARALVAARHAVTSLLPSSLFEYNLKRVYSYEA